MRRMPRSECEASASTVRDMMPAGAAGRVEPQSRTDNCGADSWRCVPLGAERRQSKVPSARRHVGRLAEFRHAAAFIEAVPSATFATTLLTKSRWNADASLTTRCTPAATLLDIEFTNRQHAHAALCTV
jgi:hypothetical protein